MALNRTSLPDGASATVAIPGRSSGGSSVVTTWNRFLGSRYEELSR
jgi:hypothetical protein